MISRECKNSAIQGFNKGNFDLIQILFVDAVRTNLQ